MRFSLLINCNEHQMGANISVVKTEILNEISTKLEASASAGAISECEVSVGDIKLVNASGCSVVNKAACSSKATASTDAIIEVLSKYFESATVEQKNSLLPGVNVSTNITDIKNKISTELSATCESSAEARNKVASGAILVEGCKDSEVVNIATGSAVADCTLRAAFNRMDEVSKTINGDQSQASLAEGLGLTEIFAIASIPSMMISCCCILFVIVFMIIMVSGSSEQPPPEYY